MFNFRTIDFGFWRDMKLEEIPFDLSSFFVWLFTNEHSHYSGLYYIPIETMSYDTGLPIEDIEKRLATLAVKPYVLYDKDTCFIWVVNMAKRQVKAGNAVNMIKGINKQLETIKSPLLVRQFIERYSDLEATQKSTGEVFTIKAPDFIGGIPKKKPRKPRTPKPKPEPIELPEWIPTNEWFDYVKMRKDKKKEMTPHIAGLIIKKLKAFKNDGEDIKQVLVNATLNQWTNVYSLNDKGKNKSTTENNDDILEEF